MRSLLLSLAVAVCCACEGRIAAPLKPPVVTPPKPEGVVALQPIRRLSGHQYRNTLRAIFPAPLGDTLASLSTFPTAGPKTGLTSGFSSDSDNTTVNTADSNAIEDNAEVLADYLLTNAATVMPQLVTCAGTSDAELDGCMPAFIRSFARKAFRRPAAPAEEAAITAAYTTVRAQQPAREAWSAVMQYFLQSPALLYRAEKGEGPGELVALGDYELATRLSFFLTDGPPDDALSAAAETGALHDPQVLEQHAVRLLETSPSAALVTSRFMREWLRVDLLEAIDDADPRVPGPLRDELLDEQDRLVRAQLSPAAGTVRSLFLADLFPLGTRTDGLYGAEGQGAAAMPQVKVTNRTGVLSSASFLTAHSPAGHQTAILRGAFLRKEVLCLPMQPFPGNVDVVSPLQDTRNAPTARERLAPTTTSSACNGCHSQINPLGFALENYDSSGFFRTLENGATIDASGTLVAGRETWTFQTPGELLTLVANSQVLTGCFAKRWYHFASGRASAAEEQPFVDAIAESANESGGTVRDLSLGVVRGQGFSMFRLEVPR